MDKKTVLKVFGEAFLRSMVVLMAIAIVGFAVFFVIKVNTDKKELAKQEQPEKETATYSDDELQAMLDDENANDTDEATTEAATEEITTEAATEQSDIPSNNKKILVLNSTRVAGVAKAWMNKLTSEGFTTVETGNYSLSQESQTKIYVAEEGMGKDLAEYFSDASIEVGSLDSGIDVSTDGVDIFIVIGSNDTSVQ